MNPKRQAIWLTVNGKPNTLRQHFVAAGYRLGFETTVCKRYKCKPSEIPVAELKKYLGESAKIIERPDNWRDLVNRKGSKKVIKKKAMHGIDLFLSMRLSHNPAQAVYY
jgi:hypothetical protein